MVELVIKAVNINLFWAFKVPVPFKETDPTPLKLKNLRILFAAKNPVPPYSVLIAPAELTLAPKTTLVPAA